MLPSNGKNGAFRCILICPNVQDVDYYGKMLLLLCTSSVVHGFLRWRKRALLYFVIIFFTLMRLDDLSSNHLLQMGGSITAAVIVLWTDMMWGLKILLDLTG